MRLGQPPKSSILGLCATESDSKSLTLNFTPNEVLFKFKSHLMVDFYLFYFGLFATLGQLQETERK